MMRITVLLFFFLITSVFSRQAVFAKEEVYIAVKSAKKSADKRPKKLEYFLKQYNSPLSQYSEIIIKTADKYQIPWELVPAIAGVESTFCQVIPYNSYNCWGWNNGATRFTDYESAIETISKSLRSNYFDRGLTIPETIGRIYAPPSLSWPKKVRYFMSLIDNTVSEDILSPEITI